MMKKCAIVVALATIIAACSGESPRYSSFSDESGTYRLNETTGEIHLLIDGRLVPIAEDSPAPTDSLTQAEIIEDFEIVIRFLDGEYETSAGEFGILDCVQSKPLDPSLSISRTRAELADALVACMDQKKWFEVDRPAPEQTDGDIPVCEDGNKDMDAGYTICMSEGEDCDHEEYWGDGIFTCKSDED